MSDPLQDALDHMGVEARLAFEDLVREGGGGRAEELAAFIAVFKTAFHLGVLVGSSYIGPAVIGRLEAHNPTDLSRGVTEIRTAFAKGIS